MPRQTNLLIFNYVMDSGDFLLSHQLETVRSLANNFDLITVVTGRVGTSEVPVNVRIVNSNWVPGQRMRNILRLLTKSMPIIIRGDFQSVFFHMTDLQCAIISPILWIRRRSQYLWYAHARKSLYLRWSSMWVSAVVTSTLGSCPLNNPKVVAIGQAIDVKKFAPIALMDLHLGRLIHIGRFDKSKNIDMLIESGVKLRGEFKDVTLTIVGSPANQESEEWSKNVIGKYPKEISDGWLTFSNSIQRDQFPKLMSLNGCFFHAYLGSLDKTLIESTLLRVPVVSINPEYIHIFGRWGEGSDISLASEYRALRNLNFQELECELLRRYSIAQKNHSLENWTTQITRLFEGVTYSSFYEKIET